MQKAPVTALLLAVACSGGPQDLRPAPGQVNAVATVEITSSASSLAVGATQQLVATTKDVAGIAVTGRIVSWSSSAPSVVNVSQTGLAGALAAGSATISATSEGKSGTFALTVTGGSGGTDPFTPLGTILRPSDFGVTSGPVADVTAIQLADGRVRLYLFAQGQGTRSAISTNAEGTTFTAETGMRSTTATWGQPRVLRLSDGRIRLYYTSGDGVRSGISTDGLTFTEESGTRIANSTVGYAIGAMSIVPAAGVGYRAYFSDLETPGAPPGGHRIRSAVSTDLLTWTLEPGIVLGVGATSGITETATHPFALANADGSVTLYYQGERADLTIQGGSYRGLYRATSTDGRTFTTEQKTGIRNGGDPDVIVLANGTTMMYYGDVDPTIGGIILAAKLNR